MDELERIELLAIVDFFAAAPPDVADELDLAVLALDGATAFSIGADPKPLLFNRVLGFVDGTLLPDLEQWFLSRSCPLAVSVHPGTEPERVLRDRGYRPGRSCVKLRRGVHQPPERRRSVRVERIDRSCADHSERWLRLSSACPSRWLAGSLPSAGVSDGSASAPSTETDLSAPARPMS